MSIIEQIPYLKDLNYDEIEQRLDFFRKYQHYLYILIFLIITIQSIFNFITPTFSEIQKKGKLSRQYEKLLSTKQKQAKNKTSIEEELNRLSGVLSDKKQIFFKETEIKEFAITEAAQILKIHSLKMISLKFDKPKSGQKGIKNFPVEIRAEGSFFAMMNFIYEIENFEKVIHVESMNIRRKSINPVTLSFTMKLLLVSIRG